MRRGVTMIELVTVLMIMGIMAAVVGLAFRGTDPAPASNTTEAAHAAIADARREALTRGVPVGVTVLVPTVLLPVVPGAEGRSAASFTSLHAVARPDGSVIADSALGINRLTGRPLQVRSEGARR